MKKIAFLTVSLLFAIAFGSCNGEKKNLTDKEILILIFKSANGENWNDNLRKNWCSEQPLNEWANVKTDEQGRVTELYLIGDSIKGSLPAAIGGLTELKKLTVVLKNYKMETPDCIPAEIGELTNLEELTLVINSKGRVNTPSLAKLTKLTQLDISGFDDYPDLTGLTALTNLEMNGIKGALPPSLYTLTELNRLFIRTDNYDGQLSPDIANLKKLTFLLIDHTAGFIGKVNIPDAELPASLWTMTELKRIFLRGISTKGTLPKEMGNMKNLTNMSLIDLGLTGEIPAEVFSLPNLKELSIYDCKLSGTIPAAVGNCTTLETLWLHDNELTGSIPREIGKLVNLKSLKLDNNQLTGAIPAELGQCKKLGEGVFVDFSKNKLSTDIPASVKALPKFEKFKF